MPSPFPGMDPYLEHPTVFPDLHDRLVALLREALRAALPAPYLAELGERAWVEVSRRPGASGAAASPARARPVVVNVPHDEHREPWVEVRVAGDAGERLVTTIEVLSPGNKTPGEHGRELYLRKQRELLGSPAHIVEIDLLRGGVHTTAVPLGRLSDAVGLFDYHVSIHRSDRFEDFLVYPILLAERLPEVAIPLLPGDAELPIDLQDVFDRAYDAGLYRRRVRYEEAAPVPPLGPDQRRWAASLLRGS